MNPLSPLCALDDIPDGDSCGLIANINGQRTSLIVVRQGQNVFAYHNLCPHIGAPLDFEPGRFLNFDKNFIMCAMHGALFTINAGNCIQGPCLGKSLTPVSLKIINNEVFIDE